MRFSPEIKDIIKFYAKFYFNMISSRCHMFVPANFNMGNCCLEEYFIISPCPWIKHVGIINPSIWSGLLFQWFYYFTNVKEYYILIFFSYIIHNKNFSINLSDTLIKTRGQTVCQFFSFFFFYLFLYFPRICLKQKRGFFNQMLSSLALKQNCLSTFLF